MNKTRISIIAATDDRRGVVPMIAVIGIPNENYHREEKYD